MDYNDDGNDDDDGVLVGRFQPLHLGHLEAFSFALARSNMLWIGIGSSNRRPSADNPFTAAEREEMIARSLPQRMAGRIRTYRIPDYGDHRLWAEHIDRTVPPYGAIFTNDGETAAAYGPRTARAVPIPHVRRAELSGTNVRSLILAGREREWAPLVPPGTRSVLDSVGAAARLRSLAV